MSTENIRETWTKADLRDRPIIKKILDGYYDNMDFFDKQKPKIFQEYGGKTVIIHGGNKIAAVSNEKEKRKVIDALPKDEAMSVIVSYIPD